MTSHPASAIRDQSSPSSGSRALRRTGALVALALAVAALAGCQTRASDAGCDSTKMTATPTEVPAGEPVVVSFTQPCRLPLDQHTTMELTSANDPDRHDTMDAVSLSEEVFDVRVTVPTDAPEGPAKIRMVGDPFVACAYDEQCPGYVVEIDVRPQG